MRFKLGKVYKKKKIHIFKNMPEYLVVTKISTQEMPHATVRYITVQDMEKPNTPEMEFEYWYIVDYYKEANDE